MLSVPRWVCLGFWCLRLGCNCLGFVVLFGVAGVVAWLWFVLCVCVVLFWVWVWLVCLVYFRWVLCCCCGFVAFKFCLVCVIAACFGGFGAGVLRVGWFLVVWAALFLGLLLFGVLAGCVFIFWVWFGYCFAISGWRLLVS